MEMNSPPIRLKKTPILAAVLILGPFSGMYFYSKSPNELWLTNILLLTACFAFVSYLAVLTKFDPHLKQQWVTPHLAGPTILLMLLAGLRHVWSVGFRHVALDRTGFFVCYCVHAAAMVFFAKQVWISRPSKQEVTRSIEGSTDEQKRRIIANRFLSLSLIIGICAGYLMRYFIIANTLNSFSENLIKTFQSDEYAYPVVAGVVISGTFGYFYGRYRSRILIPKTDQRI